MTMIKESNVEANGIRIHVAECGQGHAILLLHGWPHTWRLWSLVIPRLAEAGLRAIAADLRGTGGSARVAEGYDPHTLADDAFGVMDALGVPDATIFGIDAGAPVAFMAAMRHPDRIRRLILSESLLGNLPGAEDFLKAGAPWWFGFHANPGLAERSIVGNEEAYIGWFLTEHVRQPLPIDIRDAFVAAYSGLEALRCGFAYYRHFGEQAEQIHAATRERPVKQPVLAIIGGLVGEAIYNQLAPIAPVLSRMHIPDCGHLVR